MNSPEFALLLSSARTVPDAARIQALVASGVNWHTFFDLATLHRVRPLVCHSLRSICWEQLPADARAQWDRIDRLLTGGCLALASELLRVTSELTTAGIQVAAMKGAIIAAMVYSDITLREYEDIDLLIAETDFPRAVTLLQELGYGPFWPYDTRTVLRFLHYVGEYPLINHERRTGIDLHWRISTKATALCPSLSDFPSGLQPFAIAGASVLTFAPRDLPLYLAAQGGWDQWSDLRRICDLAEFLHRFPDVDWEPPMRAARRLGGLRSMLTGLSLASTLLDAEIPPPALHAIQADPHIARLAQHAVRQLHGVSASHEAVSRYLFQLRSKQGFAGKVALAWSIGMERTANDGNWKMLPRPLWWLYGILRPLRIGSKFFRRSAAPEHTGLG